MKTQEKHKASYLQYSAKYRDTKRVIDTIASKKKEFRMGGRDIFLNYFVRSFMWLLKYMHV